MTSIQLFFLLYFALIFYGNTVNRSFWTRKFITALLVFFSAFASAYENDELWYEEEEDEDLILYEDAEPNYGETPTYLSYGGMTVKCYKGCGQFDADPSLKTSVKIIDKVIKKVFYIETPLCFGESQGDPLDIWEKTDLEGQYNVYDWQATGGFWHESDPRKLYSVDTYPEFLKLAAALRSDFQYYFHDQYIQKLDIYRRALLETEKEKEKMSP